MGRGEKNPISDVSDTSFWVAYYRAKESERKDSIFQDPFAKRLVGEHGKNISAFMGPSSRYTEWAVVSRTVIIDRFITQAIKDGVDTIVNLGAGLDARPYRMHLPENLNWIEADYEKIIAHKNAILKNDNPHCELQRIAVDLANTAELRAFLSSILKDRKKILVLTEGVVPYLTQQQVADLAYDLRCDSRITYWITEYLHPSVYKALMKTLRSQKMKNAPFQFFPKDWFGFFESNGWIEKETKYSSEVAREFRRKPPMPFIMKLIGPFLPKATKDTFRKLTGYILLKRNET